MKGILFFEISFIVIIVRCNQADAKKDRVCELPLFVVPLFKLELQRWV